VIFEQHFIISADHPSVAGHFPGNPIVPAVVILDEVLGAFAAWRPDARVLGMPAVKFLAPLRPEQSCAVRFGQSGARGLPFDCIGPHGQPLAQGWLRIAPERC